MGKVSWRDEKRVYETRWSSWNEPNERFEGFMNFLKWALRRREKGT